MKTTLYFSHSFAGKGSWNITCEVEVSGNTKTFSHRTTDAETIDEIQDAKLSSSWEYVQRLYKRRFYWAIEDEVNEWLAEIKLRTYEVVGCVWGGAKDETRAEFVKAKSKEEAKRLSNFDTFKAVHYRREL